MAAYNHQEVGRKEVQYGTLKVILLEMEIKYYDENQPFKIVIFQRVPNKERFMLHLVRSRGRTVHGNISTRNQSFKGSYVRGVLV
jgi:hypothetical protein